ncbi:chaperone [Escherichia coli]|uniref:Chaperone n=1 Tax=Escherichia coli TaxID=562 RepID=A0A376YB57_ECOLX|nr:chaperone [Escherichia coli]
MLVVDIGGGTTDCSLLLMGPQWRSRLDREASLLGHSGCRIGGNDLDIALAFKNLMPLLGMGGETEKGIALPILPWWNAVAINDVLHRVISTVVPTVVCLTIWYAMPANRKKWPCYRKSGVSV